jgi:hypothetical protein
MILRAVLCSVREGAVYTESYLTHCNALSYLWYSRCL